MVFVQTPCSVEDCEICADKEEHKFAFCRPQHWCKWTGINSGSEVEFDAVLVIHKCADIPSQLYPRLFFEVCATAPMRPFVFLQAFNGLAHVLYMLIPTMAEVYICFATGAMCFGVA